MLPMVISLISFVFFFQICQNDLSFATSVQTLNEFGGAFGARAVNLYNSGTGRLLLDDNEDFLVVKFLTQWMFTNMFHGPPFEEKGHAALSFAGM